MEKWKKQMLELLTVDEVANILKLKPMTIRLKMYKGQIPYTKIGSSVRFKREDIENIINSGYQHRKEVES